MFRGPVLFLWDAGVTLIFFRARLGLDSRLFDLFNLQKSIICENKHIFDCLEAAGNEDCSSFTDCKNSTGQGTAWYSLANDVWTELCMDSCSF